MGYINFIKKTGLSNKAFKQKINDAIKQGKVFKNNGTISIEVELDSDKKIILEKKPSKEKGKDFLNNLIESLENKNGSKSNEDIKEILLRSAKDSLNNINKSDYSASLIVGGETIDQIENDNVLINEISKTLKSLSTVYIQGRSGVVDFTNIGKIKAHLRDDFVESILTGSEGTVLSDFNCGDSNIPAGSISDSLITVRDQILKDENLLGINGVKNVPSSFGTLLANINITSIYTKIDNSFTDLPSGFNTSLQYNGYIFTYINNLSSLSSFQILYDKNSSWYRTRTANVYDSWKKNADQNWVSDQIVNETNSFNLGRINYDNAEGNYKFYLNTLSDAQKINPKTFNAATAAYMILMDKDIDRAGHYTFETYTKTGNPQNSFYFVNFFVSSLFDIQAWAINDAYRSGGSPNNYAQPYYYTANGGYPVSCTPVNAIDQLGYTPAKIGDSWISFRTSYTAGQWFILAPYTFSSSPDLTAFTVKLEMLQTDVNLFSFYLKKNGSVIPPVNYSYFIHPRGSNTQTRAGIGVADTVVVSNYQVILAAGGALKWDYPSSIPPNIDITIYFSKNL